MCLLFRKLKTFSMIMSYRKTVGVGETRSAFPKYVEFENGLE